MRSLILLSFAAASLATEVNVIHQLNVNVLRRQAAPTCPDPGQQVCTTSAVPGGINLDCAPVCCFDSNKNFLGGCQAGSYCKPTGGDQYICCANGVAPADCSPATACVNADQTAAAPTIVCPSSVPICTTAPNGAAGCSGSFSDLVTLTSAATITMVVSPAATSSSTSTPTPAAPASSSPPPPVYSSAPPVYSSVYSSAPPQTYGTGYSVYSSVPLSTALGTGTAVGTGGATAVGNGTYTASAPPATYTGGAVVVGGRVEGVAMGAAMLGSLFAVFMA